MDLSEFFILSIATHDDRAVPKSVMDLFNVAMIAQKKFLLNVQGGTGISHARNKCVSSIRNQFPGEKSAWMFWLDSDVVLNEPVEKIAEFVKEAEKRDLSFAGNYPVVDNASHKIWNTVHKEPNVSYTTEELANASPFELKVSHAGLGLCYLKMPLGYEFHNEGEDPEDLLFFRENPDLDVRYVPISNFHMKTVWLDGR